MNRTQIGAATVLSFALAGAWPRSPALAEKAKTGDGPKTGVHPLFGLATPTEGPFPSDRFTVKDKHQNTCERVNLPMPTDDCVANRSTCFEFGEVNKLDGFNTRPRISIPFDGDIDWERVNSRNILIVSLGDAMIDGAPDCRTATIDEDEALPRPDAGWVLGIDQAVWDPLTHTLYVEPAELLPDHTPALLQQHTRYAVFVTRGITDTQGEPIEASKAFKKAIGDEGEDEPATDPAVATYQAALRRAVGQAHFFGLKRHDIAVASVFTTLSVTAAAEKIHDAVMATPPPTAVFTIANTNAKDCAAAANEPGAQRAVFDPGNITRMTYHRQGATPPDNVFTAPKPPPAVPSGPLAFMRTMPDGQVGASDAIQTLAYGCIRTPNYLPNYYLQADATMEAFATYSGSPTQHGTSDLYFELMLPRDTSGTPRPADGWPVVIWGHANNENGFSGSQLRVAALFASHGIATLSWNQIGYGFGPATTLTVEQTGGPTLTFPMAGRSYDLNGDGLYDRTEGALGIGDTRILFDRDANRQGVADVAQIIRAIEVGMDVDGDHRPDLDPKRVYYGGLSKGAVLGVLATAVEPRFKASALSSTNGFMQFQRVPSERGSRIGVMLKEHLPPLLNPPEETRLIRQLGGLAVTLPYYNEDMPDRGQPPHNLGLPPDLAPSGVPPRISGALEIQEYFERLEWLNANNGAGAFMEYLRSKPISDRAPPVLIQMARGDRTVVNPNVGEAILAVDARAAADRLLSDRVTLYRHDLFDQTSLSTKFPEPHTFLIGAALTDPPSVKALARRAQDQIAAFYNSDGANTPLDPDESGALFETPAVEIPTDYGFVVP